tara:strand:+ start:220 stop:432 length:213 start_codon:yes stop_codon:yes gene_type:complete
MERTAPVPQQVNPLCLVQRYMQMLVVMEKAHQIILLVAVVAPLRQVLIQVEMLLVPVVLGNYFPTLPLMA